MMKRFMLMMTLHLSCLASHFQLATASLHGLTTSLVPHSRSLSPIWGVLYNLGGITRYYGEYTDPLLAPCALANELFYRRGDEYVPTSRFYKAGYYLYPELIGRLVRAKHDRYFSLALIIENDKIVQQNIEINYKKLKIIIRKIISLININQTAPLNELQQQELSAALSSLKPYIPFSHQHIENLSKAHIILKTKAAIKLKKTIFNPLSAKDKATLAEIEIALTQSSDEHKKWLIEKKKKLKSLAHESTRLARIELKKLLAIDQKYFSQLENYGFDPMMEIDNIYRKQMSKNFKYLAGLIEHENHTINPILTSYLAAKINHKEEFIDYFKGLGQEHLVDEGILLQPAAFLSSTFTKLPIAIPTEIDESIYYLHNLKSQIPKPLQFTDYTQFKNQSFTDCSETALRNFFKIILNRNGTYDVSILKQIHKQTNNVSRKLINFFKKKFNTEGAQTSVLAREAWTQIVSNLDDVNYLKCSVKCEIGPGSKNMLTVIRKLLGLASDIDWHELMKIISAAGQRTIEITSYFIDDDDLGYFTFSTPHEGNFQFLFRDNHFQIDPVLNDKPNAEIMNALVKMDSSDRNLLALLPYSEDKLQLFAQKNNFIELLPLLNLRTNEEILSALKYLKEKNIKLPTATMRGFYQHMTLLAEKINFLYQIFPEQEEAFTKDLEDVISNPLCYEIIKLFENGLWASNPAKLKLFESLSDPLLKIGFMYTVLSHETKSYEDALLSLVDDDLQEHEAVEAVIELLIVANGWRGHPIKIRLFKRLNNFYHIRRFIKALFPEEIPQFSPIIKELAKNDPQYLKFALTDVYTQPLWQDQPEIIDIIDGLINNHYAHLQLPDFNFEPTIITYYLGEEFWQNHIKGLEWFELLIHGDSALENGLPEIFLYQKLWYAHEKAPIWLHLILRKLEHDYNIDPNNYTWFEFASPLSNTISISARLASLLVINPALQTPENMAILNFFAHHPGDNLQDPTPRIQE